MFIVYQIRDHHHNTIDLPNECCPVCTKKGSLKMHLMQKYMWWFGPMAPQNKFAILECGNCQQTVPNKKWSKELDTIYKKQKAEIKTPLRMWRGLIVIPAVFISLAVFAKFGPRNPFGLRDDVQNMEETTKAVKNVGEGSVLYIARFGVATIEDMKTMYSIVKINRIKGDSAYLKTYPASWGKYQDQYDIKKTELDETKFSTEETAVSFDQLKRNQVLIKGKANSFAKVDGIIK